MSGSLYVCTILLERVQLIYREFLRCGRKKETLTGIGSNLGSWKKEKERKNWETEFLVAPSL